MKTASFTVRATEKQSLRWKRAADGEGLGSVGAWLAEAADRHMDGLLRAGKPIPLGWRRSKSFTARLVTGEAINVKGFVSQPFAYYRGTDARADRYNDFFTLVYLPTAGIVATLRSAKQCRALASELAPVLLRGELPHPGPIVERHVRDSV